jgi:long-chain acyl-CoA synthetase
MAQKREVKAFATIGEMLNIAKEEAGDKIAFRYKNSDDEIVNITYNSFYNKIENLGAALTSMGYGDAHIACVGENSYNYVVTFLTVLKSAGVFCPVDKDLPENEMSFVLDNSDSRIVFCSSALEARMREIRSRLPKVDKFVVFGRSEDDGDFLSFDRLVAAGKKLSRADFDSLKSDEYDLKLLVYTSGTTGVAKGVMLTEHNLVNVVYYGLRLAKVHDVVLSVLPYHHTFEASAGILGSIHNHSTICINDSLKNTVKNMQLFKPGSIVLVPAFAEKFYITIKKNIKKKGSEKKFEAAIKTSNALRRVGVDMRKTFFKDIHEVFGGNLKKIICGGAPIRPEISEFFDSIGILLTGGYGITECSPVVCTNSEEKNSYDTAGRKLECVDWKIDEPDENGIGEICVKGETVMKGYYKNPEKTSEVIIDGWFHTGDLGYINKDEELVITGRKKNLIVLNNGKNIYPEEIEGYIMSVDYIEEVVVRGIKNEHGQETGLLAEVYSQSETDESKVLTDVQAALSELPGYKNVSKVILRDEPFDKTTTNKVKR